MLGSQTSAELDWFTLLAFEGISFADLLRGVGPHDHSQLLCTTIYPLVGTKYPLVYEVPEPDEESRVLADPAQGSTW